MYNMTAVEAANNTYEVFIATNTLTEGYMSILILGMLFMVMFMVFRKYEKDTKAVLMTVSTITVVISVLFWAIELITWTILIYPIIIFIASIIIYKFTG